MATAVIMPRQGQSVESCIIGKWHKAEGDRIEIGDLLFTYETDKATFDEAARAAGILIAVFWKEGDDVPCLANVCVIGEPGEETAPYLPDGATVAGSPSVQAPDLVNTPARPFGSVPVEAAAQPESSAPASDQATKPAAVSPRARNLAERSGADLHLAVASGPGGRVIELDIRKLIDQGKLATGGAAAMDYQAGLSGSGIGGRVTIADVLAGPVENGAASAPAGSTTSAVLPVEATPATPATISQNAPALNVQGDAGPDVYAEKHTNIRKVIARAMQASLSTMAQLTLNSSFDASDIMALRSQLKKAAADGLGAGQGFILAETVPTINDIILYAVSRVLPRHPACNAHYDAEKLTLFRHAHLGIAVDTPRGLMVPTLFGADQLTLAVIARQTRDLAASCQKGTINPDLLKGGTFTVTNLGTLGIESFTPVINPPQTCILGVNAIISRVREQAGVLSAYPAMGLSLTFDHRAVDGAPAARFLKDLVLVLESFSLMLMQ